MNTVKIKVASQVRTYCWTVLISKHKTFLGYSQIIINVWNPVINELDWPVWENLKINVENN